jgi:prepilin-type N-terminal cleavage/methylation domain-containing protein
MNNKGFTLLEVIAAIFILTVGIGSALVLISQTLSAASLAKERLIASYLVQEGIEIVRNIRDTNWLKSRTATTTWDDGLPNGDWQADYLSQNLTTYPSYDTSPLFLNIDANNFYSYSSGGSPTIFKRKITISEKTSDSMRVDVEVSWQERGRTHNFKALEYLTNWYEK